MTPECLRCPECGEPRPVAVADERPFSRSGLPHLFLRNVQTIPCSCGESFVIRALPRLLRIAAACLVHKPARLSGGELRFIRDVTQEKAADFADALSITPEHLSRLENEAKPIGESLDKLVRARVMLDLLAVHPRLAGGFDLGRFRATLASRLDPGNPLALSVDARSSHRSYDPTRPIDFAFRPLADEHGT